MKTSFLSTIKGRCKSRPKIRPAYYQTRRIDYLCKFIADSFKLIKRDSCIVIYKKEGKYLVFMDEEHYQMNERGEI